MIVVIVVANWRFTIFVYKGFKIKLKIQYNIDYNTYYNVKIRWIPKILI